ncbi:hypothetical protein DCW30_04110 [Streptomyces alfalfae]|uniref:DUF4097 domain-containing protein n=1 Tax=Streptomyces alfalfae TaxID=1642299 RepID=A0ABM6GL60_9ACTN|nr:DUF4097 family beta strand repeat-containing protein [Streptomyces alfalfae]AYA14916.1 hypothetical protein D3X13_00265 [Streptomyces fradiae]APY84419.1 hypothetical protein A7J05_00230 [Streptomyces alfalfae]APY90429.1 hypothetical protein A7J05_36505 [Streptomyces alfalfae]QUI29489.1 DUF4097 family beta strand repeat protein [Streptomyces alfalfae]RXX46884.1 hypothetical protein DCW30_04110 [Streptomyces alfalfae]
MHTFDTPAAVSAVIDLPAGRIQLIAADRTDTTVEVRPADPARNRDVQAAEQVTATCADGVLHVQAAPAKNRVLGHSGSVEVTIQLPAGSRVQAKSASTEFRGVGRLGDVTLASAQAAVKIDEASGVRLELSAGDVTLGRLTGPAHISTQKGDITLTEAVRGTLTLRTEAGAISVGAARGTSATLDAGTGYGRVHNTLRNSAGADAELHIHATTGYGDISAHSL